MARWVRTIHGIGPIIDRYEDTSENFVAIRDEIVALLKKDAAYNEEYDFNDRYTRDFTEAVQMLAQSDDRKEFDDWLDDLYDWADGYRVWIDPTVVSS